VVAKANPGNNNRLAIKWRIALTKAGEVTTTPYI